MGFTFALPEQTGAVARSVPKETFLSGSKCGATRRRKKPLRVMLKDRIKS